MESLSGAVQAVSTLYNGRPLKWLEWRHLLMERGDKLSSDELRRLEAFLSRTGHISMRSILEMAEEQQNRAVRTRRLVQWSLESGQCGRLVDSGCEQGGFVLVSFLPQGSSDTVWSQLPGMQCTRHVLDVVGDNTSCRLHLRIDRNGFAAGSFLQCPLFLLHDENNLERPVCVARWDVALSECRIDVALSAGRYTLTPLLFPEPSSLPRSCCPPLFSTEPASRKVQLTPDYRRALRHVHRALDWDCRDSLSRRQFSVLNQLTSGEEVRDAEWSIVLEEFDTTDDGRLTFAGLEQLHRLEAEDLVAESLQGNNETIGTQQIYRSSTGSEERTTPGTQDFASRPDQLWKALNILGFDWQLEPAGILSYRVNLWSELPANVHLLSEAVQLVSLSPADVAAQLHQLCEAGDSPAPGWRRLLLDSHLMVLFANIDKSLSDGGATVCVSVDHSASSNCYAMLAGRVSVAPSHCAVVQCLVRKDCHKPWKPTVSVHTSP